MPEIWKVLAGIAGGVLLFWLALVAFLVMARPTGSALSQTLRLLPDLLRLIARLARDSDLPRGVRVRLWLLLGYLALPIDVIPDFIPVIGYADDVIIIAFVLRSVIRHAGPDALTKHWPGTPEGLTTVRRLIGGPR
ncbi:YkvA family protein [Streptosporangium sp. NPDC000396]|uniref:YkvA family protein n=1 Tax=Streptosporangium sp. NPDC000396 TaxID=3366185 RepID=UPI00368B194D